MPKWTAILAMLLALCTHCGASETIRLAIGDWEPYTSAANPKGKLLEQVVTEAFGLEGVTVEYAYFPWKRSYFHVENGTMDGTFPWNRTPDREQAFILNKVSLIEDQGVFFHLKSVPFDWTSMEDLKKYRVGVTIGYKQEKQYQALGIKADPVSTEGLNFKKMLLGRIDVYRTSKVVGYTTINALFTPDQAKLFTHHPKPVETDTYFILFSRKTGKGQAYADALDAGLRKLIASGRYKRILAEHGL